MDRPYRIKLDFDRRLIWIDHKGGIDLATAAVMTAEARQLANVYCYHLLYDFRQSRITASLTAVGEFPALHVTSVLGEHPELASANLISPQDNLEYWRFYGRACESAGVIWKAFFEESEALNWLRQFPVRDGDYS